MTLDTSDYEDEVRGASKSGDSLADQLKNGVSKSAEEAGRSMDNAGSSAGILSNGFTVMKGVMANLVSGGIQAVIGGVKNLVSSIVNLDETTEEYRRAMGRLNTAFEAAGYSTETAQEAYTAFYGILGDTDTATEASQLLAQLADNAEDVSVWTNIAAGVSGTFGDSLPIEGLIEASNETAKVGTVTGVLADALNWVGISEDEFNAKLAQCTDESERNQLIMDTLSGTYSDAADAFYENNEALVSSRENQAQMDETLAKLGETISNIKTRLTSEFLPAISSVVSAFGDMLTGVEGADEAFSTAVSGLVEQALGKLPEFLNAGMQLVMSLTSGILSSIPTLIAAVPVIISNLLSSISAMLPQIVTMGMDMLEELVTGIVTGLPQLTNQATDIVINFLNYITMSLPDILNKGVEMLTNLVDGILAAIPDMLGRLPEIITSFISFVTDNLPVIVDAGINLLVNLVNGIIGAIPQLVAALPQIISSITSGLAKNLPKIIQAGVQLLLKLAEGIIKAIPQLVASLPQIISAIVSGIGSLMGGIVDVGASIVRGIWQGIQNMASWITNKVKSFFSGIVNGVKKLLGIHSPSRVFADMGENMALGLGEGWDDQFSRVKKDIEGGMDFGTANIAMTGTSESGRSGYGTTNMGGIYITVNAAAGQDAKQVAMEVSKILQHQFAQRKAALA